MKTKAIKRALRSFLDSFVGICIWLLSMIAAAFAFFIAGKIDTKIRQGSSKIVDDVLEK